MSKPSSPLTSTVDSTYMKLPSLLSFKLKDQMNSKLNVRSRFLFHNLRTLPIPSILIFPTLLEFNTAGLPKCYNHAILGAYLQVRLPLSKLSLTQPDNFLFFQTELGHGSNVQREHTFLSYSYNTRSPISSNRRTRNDLDLRSRNERIHHQFSYSLLY